MNPQEIKTLCKNGSQIYLDFLQENPNGLAVDKITINFVTLENPEQDLFKLKLATSIYNIDTIKFLIRNISYDTDRVKIVRYDTETNTLLIKPEANLREIFISTTLHPEEITIIASLIFLVEQVRDWYQVENNQIKLPTKSSKLETPKDDDFFDKKPKPDQKEAIKNVFTNPLSYIWGAPGTGKTRIVLGYSLIHYILKGKKVAVLAATNNALEQILEGVLEMTRKAKIADDKIIRLGTPSGKFAEKYPDTCEAWGIQKEIVKINKQIEIITGVIEVNKITHTLNNIKNQTYTIFSQLEAFRALKEEKRLEIKSLRQEIENEQIAFDSALSETTLLQERIKDNEIKANSFFYRLKKKFIKSPTELEIKIKEQKTELVARVTENQEKGNKIKEVQNRYNILKEAYVDFSDGVSLIQTLKNSSSGDNTAHEIMAEVTFKNYSDIKLKLIEYLEKRNAELLNYKIFALEYKDCSEEDLTEKLIKLQERRDFLQTQTSDERIKNVNVIALTLDCYIHNYKEVQLMADHIFLDEAGYACLVKALTLFRGDIPITFLGDHKQLPPVCEMNNNRINTRGQKSAFVWAQSALSIEWLFEKTQEELFTDYITGEDYEFDNMIKTDLRETHRFGTQLASVLNKYVYKNGFTSHKENTETKIYYIDASHFFPPPFLCLENNTNVYEVSKVEHQVDCFDQESFSIITPYKNQVQLLKHRLPELRDNIMTIHRSQSREWNDVVLSPVATSMAGMWFINNDRPEGLRIINTAVSRAKNRLIIVCDYNFWIREENQQQLIHGLLQVAEPFVNST